MLFSWRSSLLAQKKGKDKYSLCCCWAAIHEALNSLFDYTLCALVEYVYLCYLFILEASKRTDSFVFFVIANKTFWIKSFVRNHNTRHEISISPWAARIYSSLDKCDNWEWQWLIMYWRLFEERQRFQLRAAQEFTRGRMGSVLWKKSRNVYLDKF